VLDISKIEAGQLILALDNYSLQRIVEIVVATTGSLARAKGIEIRAVVSPDLPAGYGDERRLTQVLLNLVGNAIKFTDAGSVEVHAKAMDDHFILAVQDTGPGIPPEDLVRIFEDFQQVDNSITRQKGGHWTGAVDRSSSHRNAWRPHRPGHDSGRGFDIHHLLADTRDRSEAGGMTKRILVVEDTENNRRILNDLLTNAGFEVMETVDREKGVAMAAERRPRLRAPPRILVVDDNPTNLEVLRVRLNAQGYEVVTAVDGEDALKQARELEPGLVLLNIVMSKLDGISVLKELKRDTTLACHSGDRQSRHSGRGQRSRGGGRRPSHQAVRARGIGGPCPLAASHQGPPRHRAIASRAVEGTNRATLGLESNARGASGRTAGANRADWADCSDFWRRKWHR
jgi:CheY-like chemotaxis protein